MNARKSHTRRVSTDTQRQLWREANRDATEQHELELFGPRPLVESEPISKPICRPAKRPAVAKQPPAQRRIPCYDSDGNRLRACKLAAIEALLASKRVIVERNQRGKIVCATFRPLPRNSPAVGGKGKLRKNAHLGQHYSVAESVDDSGRPVWRFVDFLVPGHRGNRLEFELELQRIFRAVPLSCMASGTGSSSAGDNGAE